MSKLNFFSDIYIINLSTTIIFKSITHSLYHSLPHTILNVLINRQSKKAFRAFTSLLNAVVLELKIFNMTAKPVPSSFLL